MESKSIRKMFLKADTSFLDAVVGKQNALTLLPELFTNFPNFSLDVIKEGLQLLGCFKTNPRDSEPLAYPKSVGKMYWVIGGDSEVNLRILRRCIERVKGIRSLRYISKDNERLNTTKRVYRL